MSFCMRIDFEDSAAELLRIVAYEAGFGGQGGREKLYAFQVGRDVVGRFQGEGVLFCVPFTHLVRDRSGIEEGIIELQFRSVGKQMPDMIFGSEPMRLVSLGHRIADVYFLRPRFRERKR